MRRSDAAYTRLTADLLAVTKGFCEYGEGKGLLTPDGLRFAVTKRQEMAKQLAAAGASQRQISKATGVSQQQVSRDLRGRKVTPKVSKATPKASKAAAAKETANQLASEPVAFLQGYSEGLRAWASNGKCSPAALDAIISVLSVCADGYRDLATELTERKK